MRHRRSLFTVAALLLLATVHLSAITDWALIVKPVSKQVVRLEALTEGDSAPAVCSGVVINREADYVLTCAHCIDVPQTKNISITINRRHAEVVRANLLLDLAIVRTSLRDETAMPLAEHTPPIGSEIAIVGFAFGDGQLIAQFGRIAQALNDTTKLIFVDAGIVPGDSGGALIDDQGRLIGIASRVYGHGPSHLAAAVSIEDVREFAKPYLPAVKP